MRQLRRLLGPAQEPGRQPRRDHRERSIDGPTTLTINKSDVAVKLSGNDDIVRTRSGNPAVQCPVADASPTGRNRWQFPRISDGHGGMPAATTGAASPSAFGEVRSGCPPLPYPHQHHDRPPAAARSPREVRGIPVTTSRGPGEVGGGPARYRTWVSDRTRTTGGPATTSKPTPARGGEARPPTDRRRRTDGGTRRGADPPAHLGGRPLCRRNGLRSAHSLGPARTGPRHFLPPHSAAALPFRALCLRCPPVGLSTSVTRRAT